MPKFIGNEIPGATIIGDDSVPVRDGQRALRLSYAQAILLPASDVFCSLNTRDRGSKGSFAKRWYNWFALPNAILACEKSTKKMRALVMDNASGKEVYGPVPSSACTCEGDCRRSTALSMLCGASA